MLNEIYGLDKPIKSFAVANKFVETTNKACYALGQHLQPFCMYANEKQKEYKVVDLANFNGFVDKSKSLIDEIVEYRIDSYKDNNIYFDLNDPLQKKLIFYDYLLSISVCYIELPKWTTKNGYQQETYDKYLVTKNPALMGTWMGQSPSEMQIRYSVRIGANSLDYGNNELRFAKLGTSKKGNTITIPRSSFKVEKMSCIPLYMLYGFIEGFKPIIQDKIVKFSYLKDNGTIRELATTLNESILMDYYKDNMFVSTMLGQVDINTVQQGGLMLSSKMHRGYIKVPEVGASRYDDTGARSLNIARLLKAEVVDSVDRTFIDVDLKSVCYSAELQLEYALNHHTADMKEIYLALTGESEDSIKDETDTEILGKAEEYIRRNDMLFSTTFHRVLHKFLILHPTWFPEYTGRPLDAVAKNIFMSTNIGVIPEGF